LSGPISLSEVDFDEIKDNLIAYLKSTKQFTDYDFAGSNLQVILNLIAYQAQLNAYSTNLIANESFLATSSIRKNVVANARSLGYVPTSARSSFSRITFQFQLFEENYPSGFPRFLELQPGVAFSSSAGKQGFIFNSIETQITPVSSEGVATFENIPVYEGVFLTNNFEVDESEYNQKFVIENQGIDTTTIRVEVQEDPNQQVNAFYRQADNLVELTSESRVYWIEEVDRQYYELVFGDGFFGKKLQNGAKIFITYVAARKADSNGVQGTDNFRFIGNVVDSEGATVVFDPTVTAVTKSDGGSSIESVNSIKFRAPREYSAQNRCVVAEDYETIIRKVFPPVDDIYVYGGETLEIPEFGRIYVAIKPRTGDALSNTTKNYIKKSLDPYRVASLDIILVDPQVLYIEIVSLVYFDEKKTLKDQTAITTTVVESLKRYVQSTAIPRFGGAVKYSKLVGVIDDSDKSITRNNTYLLMRKDVPVLINQPSTYEVCTNQPILIDKEASVAYSSGFQLNLAGRDDPRTFYFENDPRTIRNKSEDNKELISDIYCFYFNDFNEKIKVNFYINKYNELIIVDVLGDDTEIIPFGTLNIDRGEVLIGYQFKNGVTFVSTEKAGNVIQIRLKPREQDIFAVESVFLEIDVDNSDIQSVIDVKTQI